MVDIDIAEGRRNKIAGKYYLRLCAWIDKKEMWTVNGNAVANAMMVHMKGHFREYVLAQADKLIDKSNAFSTSFAVEKSRYEGVSRNDKPETNYGIFIKRMRDIYKGFMQDTDENGRKNGYWLMKKLGVKVCPYCNRNYTVTVATRDIQVRPEYDHFWPEALHPSLILSFYNLVPSCPQCNHLKKVQELDVNPWQGYKESERPHFRVDTSTGDFPARPVILIENGNRNTQRLGVKELYNEHRDYVKDILDKIQAYNPVTYHAINKDFQGIVHTETGLERMIWGNYTEMDDAGKRPMAKLTADILEQYKKYI